MDAGHYSGTECIRVCTTETTGETYEDCGFIEYYMPCELSDEPLPPKSNSWERVNIGVNMRSHIPACQIWPVNRARGG